MRELEKDKMKQMEKILLDGDYEPDLFANLFPSSVREEMATYSKH